MVLSLQGGMAVGKTTAARYLARHAPDLHVCLEDNRAVIGQVQRLGLDKTRCDDYIRIQRLWLQHEVDRWQQARPWPCTVMDFGAEEIEFYTLHYPRTIGQDWDVEGPLARELTAVRRCMPRRILFLDAPDPVLRRRKEGDAARDQGFFEHYLQELLPLKRAWFAQKDNVDVLQTAGMTPEQVGAAALEWAVRWSR
ncbi:MAG TPA: ATP-binding protein [Candidatus Faecalibacterium avium]|nr:ATP-binding protein [Candidatus Faecalibacterium avium]